MAAMKRAATKAKKNRGDWKTSVLDSLQADLTKQAAAVALIQRVLAEADFPKPIQPDAVTALVRKRMADDAKFRRAMWLAGFSGDHLFGTKTPREAGHLFIWTVKRYLSGVFDGPRKEHWAQAIKWMMAEMGITMRDIMRLDGKPDPRPDLFEARTPDAGS